MWRACRQTLRLQRISTNCVQGACGGNRAEWFCAPKAAVTTRSVFMAPLWFVSFVSIMAACGNALTWTSEQGAQNGPGSTRHTHASRREQARERAPRARARESRRAREQARARAGARTSEGRRRFRRASDFSAASAIESKFKRTAGGGMELLFDTKGGMELLLVQRLRRCSSSLDRLAHPHWCVHGGGS